MMSSATAAGEHVIERPGGRLHVRAQGAGLPVLLLHGWPLDSRMFEPQLRALSARFHVLALDRRGFGRSEAPPDLRAELEDIDAVAAAFTAGPFHLLGVSQGARIALRYAATRPTRLRSLVVQGPVIDNVSVAEGPGEAIPLAHYRDLLQAGRLDAFREAWLAHPMMALDGAPAAARRLVSAVLADYGGADLLAYTPEAYAFPVDVLAGLARLECPALVINGEYETAGRRRHSELLRERIPDCRERTIAGCGHLCNLAAPEAYNAAVIEFLQAVAADPSP